MDTATLFYDVSASRVGDRVWKVTMPVGDSLVAHVPVRVAPDAVGDLTDAFEPALEAATALLREAGYEPEWRERVHALDPSLRLASTKLERVEP